MTIIAAVDRSDRKEAVVREAASLADAFDEDVHVVHVLSRSEFTDIEQTSVEETGQTIEVDRVREFARDVCEDAAEGVLDDYEAVGLVGDAAEELIRYAEDHDARYIVVAGRKRSPIGKVLFGSVTQSVLLSSPCSVVTVIYD